ncbi:MAG: hypothetical protein II196_07745, partial [Spirochaetales bacterium]|nr:hypothetical protein [Spirochaetales bacterium]
RQELTPNEFVERAEREGIELEKGAVITNEYLDRHYEDLCKWINFFLPCNINVLIFNKLSSNKS